MTRTGLILAAMVVVILALALSVVIWPAVAPSAKLAYFALGFAAGAAATWSINSGRAAAT